MKVADLDHDGGNDLFATRVRYVLLYATILRLHTSFYHENSSPASFIHLTDKPTAYPVSRQLCISFLSLTVQVRNMHFNTTATGDNHTASLCNSLRVNPRALEKTCRQPMMHVWQSWWFARPDLGGLVGAVQRPSRFPPTPRRIGFADFGINIGADSAPAKLAKHRAH